MKYAYREYWEKYLAEEKTLCAVPVAGDFRVLLCYPNRYETGSSNLGFQGVWGLLNQLPNTVAHRAFMPPQSDWPVVSMETREPAGYYDWIGFSISYEVDFVNAVRMIESFGLSGVDRPLLFAGGAAITLNPFPLAKWFDFFVIGEAEELLARLLATSRGAENRGKYLQTIATEQGVYVPGISSFPIRKHQIKNINESNITTYYVTPYAEFPNTGLIELGRGCVRRCFFCLARYSYFPLRIKSTEKVLAEADAFLGVADQVGLFSASAADHPRIKEMYRGLLKKKWRVNISSLRIDALDEELLVLIRESGQESLTLAPETGSALMKALIEKRIPNEQILALVEIARRLGFRQLKLYFMIGFPGEGPAELDETIVLIQQMRDAFRGMIRVSVNPFIPKAHTPMQWFGMEPVKSLQKKIMLLRKAIRPVSLGGYSPAEAPLQVLINRCDEESGAELLTQLAQGTRLRPWLQQNRALQKICETHYAADHIFPANRIVVNSGIDKLRIQYLKLLEILAQGGKDISVYSPPPVSVV